MPPTLGSSLQAKIAWNQGDALDLSRVVDAGELVGLVKLENGSGNDQANRVWHGAGAIASSGAPVTLDLTALSRSIFGDSVATNFASVKAILVANLSDTVSIEVGDAASDPFDGPFGGVADGKVVIGPGGFWAQCAPKAGWTTTGKTDLKLAIASGASVGYRIAILGVGA